MKYIYYVIAVMVVFSALAAYGLFDARVEISKPVVSVNDRVVSEGEFEKMLIHKPAYMNQEQFVDSVIEKQLLIQEAVKEDINKEESFRQSVQNFYEQSLVKILLDRKLKSLVVDVTDEEIEKYRIYSGCTFKISKFTYPSMADAFEKTETAAETIVSDFINLSEDLKYLVLHLDLNERSKPYQSRFGAVVYVVENKNENPSARQKADADFDIKKVSLFIRDKKKEDLMNRWMVQIRESADIWRKK